MFRKQLVDFNLQLTVIWFLFFSTSSKECLGRQSSEPGKNDSVLKHPVKQFLRGDIITSLEGERQMLP